MHASLLSLRLQLQQCAIAPPPEPVLRVGTSWVGALWNCGCASVGHDFGAMTFVPCRIHEVQAPFRRTSISDMQAPITIDQ